MLVTSRQSVFLLTFAHLQMKRSRSYNVCDNCVSVLEEKDLEIKTLKVQVQGRCAMSTVCICDIMSLCECVCVCVTRVHF